MLGVRKSPVKSGLGAERSEDRLSFDDQAPPPSSLHQHANTQGFPHSQVEQLPGVGGPLQETVYPMIHLDGPALAPPGSSAIQEIHCVDKSLNVF